jgi:hypothetical protein|tara:strand:- start:3320 stop:3664 length:345 start_codon:yes stop_codon:yes gene_type:complete
MSNELINNIKVWIDIENKISLLQIELKKLKSYKKKISEELKNEMKKDDLDNIDTHTGQIRYVKNNVKKSFNKKDLKNILEMYFNDKNEADKIIEYINNNREVNVKETIQFKKKV